MKKLLIALTIIILAIIVIGGFFSIKYFNTKDNKNLDKKIENVPSVVNSEPFVRGSEKDYTFLVNSLYDSTNYIKSTSLLKNLWTESNIQFYKEGPVSIYALKNKDYSYSLIFEKGQEKIVLETNIDGIALGEAQIRETNVENILALSGGWDGANFLFFIDKNIGKIVFSISDGMDMAGVTKIYVKDNKNNTFNFSIAGDENSYEAAENVQLSGLKINDKIINFSEPVITSCENGGGCNPNCSLKVIALKKDFSKLALNLECSKYFNNNKTYSSTTIKNKNIEIDLANPYKDQNI